MRTIEGELGEIGRRLCAIAERGIRGDDLLTRPAETAGSQCNQVAGVGRPVDPDYILKELFTYHAPDQEQQKQYETIRDAAFHLARVILKNTPPGADRTTAITRLRECVMTANGGIALRGLSL